MRSGQSAVVKGVSARERSRPICSRSRASPRLLIAPTRSANRRPSASRIARRRRRRGPLHHLHRPRRTHGQHRQKRGGYRPVGAREGPSKLSSLRFALGPPMTSSIAAAEAEGVSSARVIEKAAARALCRAGEIRRWSGCRAPSSPRRSARSAWRRRSARCACSSSGTGSTCAARQSFDAMTSVSKELRAALAEHFTLARPGSRRRAGLGRRHAQMAVAAARRERRRARRMRSSASISRNRPRHAVHVEPGRLHAQLLVLPHRHAAAGAQSHRRRDRRPGHGGARPARRLAARRAPSRRSREKRRSSPTS